MTMDSTQNQQVSCPPWYAVRVKSNFEFSSANILRAHGLETYLPTLSTRRRWSDRIKEVEAPLFPGYLFSRFEWDKRRPVITTPGVVGIVSAGKTLLPVDEAELEAVRAILLSNVVAGPWPFLKVGREVELVRGPLSGLEGILVKVKSSFRLVVSVSLLQRSLAAEIDADWVRPKPERRQVLLRKQIPA